jgi:hypothetical protein
MLVRLAKADPGVEANRVERDPGRHQCVAAVGEVGGDVVDDIFILGIILHGLRRSPHVHDAETSVRLSGDFEHRGISREARHVVDNLGPGGNRLASDHGLARINRNRDAHLTHQLFDHRHDPAEFLLSRDRVRIGTGTLAPYVEQVSPLVHEVEGTIDSLMGVEVVPPVREAIGGHVDDAHP